MARKNGCFFYVKKLFIPHPHPPEPNKGFLERFQIRRRSLSKTPQTTVDEDQRKHAMAVASAAVAATNSVTEVVRTTYMPRWKTMCLAALKIQTSYRAHLARKALLALKGIVKLQAVIRGEITRTIVKMIVYQRRVPTMVDYMGRNEIPNKFNQKEPKLHINTQRNRDCILGLKEDSYLRTQEASAKREMIRQYLPSIRGSRKYEQIQKNAEPEANDHQRADKWKNHFTHSRDTTPVRVAKLMQLKLRSRQTQETWDEQNYPPFSLPRRSYCQARDKAVIDEGSLPNSPVFPRYMAATESARAKCRSVSMPKQRLRLQGNDQRSPYKLSLSPHSSAMGETTNTKQRNIISSLSDRMVDQYSFL